MSTPLDDIFCELTPPGHGGISTLALLGRGVHRVADIILRSKHGGAPRPGRLTYGRVVREDGETIDEVIVRGVTEAGPAGEVEIHCHGGPAAVQALAARLEQFGLRRVDWPEYLRRRAGLHGVSQIVLESELLLPTLATLPAALLVVRQRNGLLAAAIESAEELVAGGSFPAALAETDRLLSAYEQVGRHIERPPRVAILGAPNVGKSSLLNCLVGRERAIVTDIPGTTRDVVTETTGLAGLPVVMADTAGLPITSGTRGSPDLVEQLGIERSRAEALHADVLLYLVDLSRPPSADEQQWVGERPSKSVLVGTKADLAMAERFPMAVEVATSSLTREGLERLVERILAALAFRWPDERQAVPFTVRQVSALRAAREAIVVGDTKTAQSALSAVVAPAQAE